MNTIIIIYLMSLFSGMIEGYFDGRRSFKGKHIEHGLSSFFRVVGTSIVAHLLGINYLLIIPSLFLYSATLDIFFNLGRGNHIYYIGRTAKLDKLIRKSPIKGDGFLYLMLKIMFAFIVFIIFEM